MDCFHYLPILLMAATILILGFANLKAFQATKGPHKMGYPDYRWLAAISAAVGALAVWGAGQGKR